MKLITKEAIDAEYERLAAHHTKHCTTKNTAQAKLAEALKDPTIVGTSIFRTLTEAYTYYSRQHTPRQQVDRKIVEKEISIDFSPEGEGKFDSDGRWQQRFQEALIREYRRIAADEGNAEHKVWSRMTELRESLRVVHRINHATEKGSGYVSKTELERFVREYFHHKWGDTLKDMYCFRDRPYYKPADWEKVWTDKRNNIVVTFTGKDGVMHRVAFLNKIMEPTADIWGMHSRGTEMYYIGDEIEHMYSMRELVVRITEGHRDPI